MKPTIKGKNKYLKRMYKHLRKEHPSTKKRMKLLPAFLISLVLFSILVAGVINQYRSELSDLFNNYAYDTTKWTSVPLRTWTSPADAGYCNANSINEASQAYLEMFSSCNAAPSGYSFVGEQWNCLNYSFGHGYDVSTNLSYGYYDVYIRMNSTLRIAANLGGAEAYFKIFITNRTNATSTQITTLLKEGLTTASTIVSTARNYTIRFTNIPDLQTATLYINGVVNNTKGLSLFPDWYLCWATGATMNGALIQQSYSWLQTFNVSTFFSDVSLTATTYNYQNETPETSYNTYFSEFLAVPAVADTAVSANLIYNGVSYPATISAINPSYKFNVTSHLDVPAVDVDTNFNFYWNITTSLAGVQSNSVSDTYTQTVNDTTLEECSGTGYPYLNITMKELGSFDEKNASIGISLLYWLGHGTTQEAFVFNNLDANKSRFNFCFAPQIYPITAEGVFEFFYTDSLNYTYPHSQYYFDNTTLSNSTTLLNLYLITDNSSELVTFRVIDQNFNVIPNAFVRVQYYDVFSGNYYTSSIGKTNAFGETQQWIKRYTRYYQYQVVYNNKLYLQTQPMLETELTRTLQINLIIESPYTELGNVTYSFTYNNNTKIFTYIWADTQGLGVTGCLVVKPWGNATTLNNECLTSASGTLTYSLASAGNGTFIGQAILQHSDGTRKVLDTIFVTIGTANRFIVIGSHGIIPAIILIGTLFAIGISAGSIPFALMLMVVGIIVSFILGAANFNPFVIYLIIGVCIIIFVFARRRSG